MSRAQDSTWSEDGLECPGCGYLHQDSGDGELYPRDGGIEATLNNFECEQCGLVFDAQVEFTPRWTAEHPRKCDVKGYHVVTERKDKRECLYCYIELPCDCEVWSYEKATNSRKELLYTPQADRPGHCKHQINQEGLS